MANTTDKGGKPTKRVLAARTVKEAKILDAYLAGKTLDGMAKELGYANRSSMWRALQNALRARAKERAELADEALELQLSRFDTLLDTHMRIALDESKPLDAARSAGVVLQIMDRQCKLLGLDQPQRHEVHVTTVDDVDREIAELAAKLTDKARTEGADLDVPVIEALIEHGRGGAAS